jgi:twitching motility two-component system response regulator PilG
LEWWHPAKTPRIVCIDDGVTVREIVEQILGQHGYEATSIGNPLKALSLVFQLKPDLILCDIAMPELDGYEICAMLRKSTAFRQIPIIMLTGKDGFIDRVRAKMVGATDYLTKPFGEGELLMLVEKYVGSGSLEPVQAGELFADLAENALELDRVDATSASSAPFS